MNKLSLILVSFVFPLLLFSQNNDFERNEKLFSNIKINTVTELTEFINTNYDTEIEKLDAAYFWITHNISYDLNLLNKKISYDNLEDVVKDVLKNRKGVCMHYSTLFDTLAKNFGVESYAINGFTKQNDTVMNLSHAWNICRLKDSTWMAFDPTWGAGYIMDDKFHNDPTYKYFAVEPSQMIISHIPYDPMWQLLFYPITNQEFYYNIYEIEKVPSRYFNFNDTIELYKNKEYIDVLKAKFRRIEKNGVVNQMIVDELNLIAEEINYHESVKTTNTYNVAVESVNNAADAFNEFISYRNKQFQNINEEILKELIVSAKSYCDNALSILDNINNDDKTFMKSVKELKNFVNDLNNNISEQEKFLNKYLSTPESKRIQLFYR